MSGLTAVSLFAGIGGIDRALELAGIRVVAAVEIDAACRGVLARHLPAATLFDDVETVTADDLRAAGFVPGRGILAAGWPCQGNSVAGRRAGMADPRSGLWLHVARLLAELRPRWFLGENVPGLLSVNDGEDIWQVLSDLDRLRYVVNADILDAQFFGVPQRRRRLFFTCQQADHILATKTTSSALTISQCLTEILACILAVARQRSLTAYPSSVSARWLSVDGLSRRMKLFGLGAGPTAWKTCLEHLAAAPVKSPPAQPGSESVSGSDEDSPGEATSSLRSVRRVTPSLSTGLSWSKTWADVYETARLCTTSTPSSAITESGIYSCALALLSISEHIARLSASFPNYWSAASSASTALREYTSYARQSANNLFGDLAWADRWHDFARQAADRVFFAGHPGDRAAPVQVLLEPESGEWDSAQGSQARAGAAGGAASGAGSPGTVGTLGGNGPGGGWRVGADEAAAGQLVASTLQGGGRRGHRVDAEGAAGGHLIAAPLTAGSAASTGVNRPGRRQEDDVNLVTAEIAYALTARNDRNDRNDREQTWVAHALTSEGFDASEDGTGRSTPIVPLGVPLLDDDTPMALTAGGGQPGQGYPAARHGAAVRRLTPRECERLQGFPDDWTRWTVDGREQSDSARYRQLGNAVAVPVAEWICSRIAALENGPEAVA